MNYKIETTYKKRELYYQEIAELIGKFILENKINNLVFFPSYKFLNEIMGLPQGEGDVAITEEMLREICIENLPILDKKCPQNAQGASYIVAGIDWGGGGFSGISRTVLSIYAVYPDREEIVKIFGKIFSQGEPTKHVEEIAFYLRSFMTNMVFGDHGGGNFAMSQLRQLVPDIRVIPVMYTDQSAPFKWDERAGRYTVNRTIMIDAFLSDLKTKKI